MMCHRARPARTVSSATVPLRAASSTGLVASSICSNVPSNLELSADRATRDRGAERNGVPNIFGGGVGRVVSTRWVEFLTSTEVPLIDPPSLRCSA